METKEFSRTPNGATPYKVARPSAATEKPSYLIFGEEVCRIFMDSGRITKVIRAIDEGTDAATFVFTPGRTTIADLLSAFEGWGAYSFISKREYNQLARAIGAEVVREPDLEWEDIAQQRMREINRLRSLIISGEGFHATFIKSVETHHTGGNVMVDRITLKHLPFVIGISEHCVTLYKSEEEFLGDENSMIANFDFPDVVMEGRGRYMSKREIINIRLDEEIARMRNKELVRTLEKENLYLLFIYKDVEPLLLPAKSEESLLRLAQTMRKERGPEHGYYKLAVQNNKASILTFAGDEALDDSEDNDIQDRENYYTNYYKCACGFVWQDTWTAACNDRCPMCNKEIKPYKSDILMEDAGIYSRPSFQCALFTSEQMTGSGQLNMLDQINEVADVKRRIKTSNIIYWNDPGHGWFEVSYKDLVLLDIHLIISGYSYRKGDKVYLEEDCDIMKYVKAIFGEHPENDPDYNMWRSLIKEEYREDIFIRKLSHYRP